MRNCLSPEFCELYAESKQKASFFKSLNSTQKCPFARANEDNLWFFLDWWLVAYLTSRLN